MTEVRQHPDGRTALRLADAHDDLDKGTCTWLAVTPPSREVHLFIALLNDAEVADWTPLVPLTDAEWLRRANPSMGRPVTDEALGVDGTEP